MFKRILLVFTCILFITACKKENAGSKIPQINPVQGTIKVDWGDTISIAGKNLPPDAKVFFNQNQSTVISNDGTTIRCVVPVSFDNQITSTVYIKYSDQTIELKDYITLNAPVITSFTQTQAIGDTIIIKGNHFNAFDLQVNFGKASSKAFMVSKQLIKAVVPDEIKSVHDTINVTSQLQTVASSTIFEVLKPEITSVTPNALLGGKVTINGKYFHPGGPYSVYLDGTLTSDRVESKTVISFDLPYKPYPRRKTTVMLKLLEYEITYPTDVNIDDNWILVSQGVPFTTNIATTPLTVGSYIYVVAPAKGSVNPPLYLWRFNQADFSWTKIGNQAIDIKGGYCTGTNGNKIYLYDSGGPNAFYECDPMSGTWTAKTNFVGQQRDGAAMFGLGGKLYLGAGSYYVNNNQQALEDWYAYTPGTNSWTRIADMQTGASNYSPMSNAQTVVVNNIAYVLCGGWFFDFKYNPSINTWTPMQNMLEPRIQVGVVSYQNKIYTLKGYLVQNVGNPNRNIFGYDIASDQWAFDPGTIDPYGDELTIGFTSNGKIYMLSYNTYDGLEKLYEAIKLPF